MSSSIAQKAVRGASWSIVTSIGSRALGLVGTLAITHFLMPDVIGEVSDAFVLVTTVGTLTTWGFGQYLIAKPNEGADVTWHVTVYHVGLGIIGLAALLLFGTSFEHFLHAPNLGRYLPGLVFVVFMDRLGAVPERLLTRTMRFRTIGLSRSGGELAYSAVSLGLAMVGVGGMSLVWGNIARSVIRSGALMAAVEAKDWLKPHKLSRETTRTLLKFGLPFAVSANAAFASRRWDNLIVSALFGPAVLGSYNMAYNLADIPAVQVGEQMNGVLLPAMSSLEPAARKAAVVRSTGLMALAVFPLAVGLGTVARSLIALILSPEWQGVAPLLSVLAVLSVVRPMGWSVFSYLASYGRNRTLMALEAAKVVLLFGCILSFAHLGPVWTAGSVGIAFGAQSLITIGVVVYLDKLPAWPMALAFIRPLAACAAMAAAVLGTRAGLEAAGVDHPAILTPVEIAVGVVTYIPAAFVFARPIARDFVVQLKRALKRGG